MESSFKRIAVVGKYDSQSLAGPLEKLIAFLEARGLSVVLDNRSAAALAPNRAPVVD